MLYQLSYAPWTGPTDSQGPDEDLFPASDGESRARGELAAS